jgi:hypothetical protein
VARSELVDKDGNFAPNLNGLQKSETLDAYLIVIKLNRQLQAVPFSRGVTAAGVGLWDPPAKAFESAPPAVYASYAIAVVDAKDLHLISSMGATVGPKYPRAFPYVVGDDRLRPKKRSAPTAAEIAAIQQVLSPLLKDSVDETLLQMDLTDQVITDELPSPNPTSPR